MRFENPELLLLAPALLAFVVYAHYRLYGRVLPRMLQLENPMLKVIEKRSRGNKRVATLLLKILLVTLLSLAVASPYLEVEKTVSREVVAEVHDVLQAAGPAVVVVVDVSGSMGDRIPGGVKIDVAKAAINRFLDRLPGNVSVGLVAFDDAIYLSVPVTSNRTAILDSVKGLAPRGGTMYTYPLATAYNMLRPYRAFNASCTVVFVSDGLPADQGSYDQLLGEMKSSNIIVHTVYIGPGGDVGAEEMRRIASMAGGQSFTADTADRLIQVLEELSSKVTRYSAGYRAKVILSERIIYRINVGWLLLLASVALLMLLLYARYRTLGLTI